MNEKSGEKEQTQQQQQQQQQQQIDGNDKEKEMIIKEEKEKPFSAMENQQVDSKPESNIKELVEKQSQEETEETEGKEIKNTIQSSKHQQYDKTTSNNNQQLFLSQSSLSSISDPWPRENYQLRQTVNVQYQVKEVKDRLEEVERRIKRCRNRYCF